jgi:putative ABC transport system permease protein
VSAILAAEFGWRLGDRIRLKGPLFATDVELTVQGLYHSTRHGFARRAVWMHWEYMNELLQPSQRDQVNVISAQIMDKSAGAELAMSIDRFFAAREPQTFSQEDQASSAAFVGMFAALLEYLNIAGVLMLGIILLLVGNTMSMATRERAHELGVLRAIGFSAAHATAFILSEAAIIGLLGGIGGVVLAYPLLQMLVSRYFEQALQVPPLEVPLSAGLTALLLGGVLGLIAAALPAYGIAKLKVVDALRRV